MARFSVRGLTVRYGGVVALEGLDLDIAEGEIFVLVGGSGSGKTTLLRVAGGFLRADSGRVELGGVDITDLPPHRRKVNTMFQSYALFPHLDVAANIGFGLRRQRLPSREIAARVEELLGLVRLEGYGQRRIHQLSGGQQQRVALARSVAPRPQLLLLDEPLSALDRGLREETRADLVALLRRFGTTAVMVTHDQEEALATADRIGLLNRGRLEQVGTPADLYERPATRMVASFLGAANILAATVRRAGPSGTVLALAGGQEVTAPPSTLAPGAQVHVGLRPERLHFASGEEPNHLRGTVASSVYRGLSLDVVLTLPDGTALRVTRPLGEGLRDVPAPGAIMSVGWVPEAAMLLQA
jgi:ABC-type Fe3+/spermidine/putrescine transport system ATPase subunit